MKKSVKRFDWRALGIFLLGMLAGIWLLLGWLSVSIVETADNVRIENVQLDFNETALVEAMVEAQKARGLIPSRVDGRE